MHLRKFDLNLLVIFQAILSSKSVVAAAQQVGLSPSAISHALARLRVMFNDELFQRTSRGLEPTERAIALAAEIEAGLAHISNALEGQHCFDPARAERVFTIQIADYISGMLLAPLARRLQNEAPGVSVQVLPFATGANADKTATDVQVRFTPGDEALPATRAERLIADKFMVVMRPDHPAAAKKLTPESYAALNHVRLSPAAIGTMMVDEALARRGLKRRIVMSVPTWFDLPDIVGQSGLVAILPNRSLHADARLARLCAKELPLPEVKFAIDLCWDARRDRDPGQKWFRTLIKSVFREEVGGLAENCPLGVIASYGSSTIEPTL
jgi:DNA-binding transcriptional LysR family regulator